MTCSSPAIGCGPAPVVVHQERVGLVVGRRRPLQRRHAGEVAARAPSPADPSAACRWPGSSIGIVQVDRGRRRVGHLAGAAERAARVVEAHLDVAHRGQVLLELELVVGAEPGRERCDTACPPRRAPSGGARAASRRPSGSAPSLEKTRSNMLYGLVSLAIGWSEPA